MACTLDTEPNTAANSAMAVANRAQERLNRHAHVADEVVEALAQQRIIRVCLEAEAGKVVGRPRQGRRQRHGSAQPAGVRQRLPLQAHHLYDTSTLPVMCKVMCVDSQSTSSKSNTRSACHGPAFRAVVHLLADTTLIAAPGQRASDHLHYDVEPRPQVVTAP